MSLWYGLDGKPITVDEAEKLLPDELARRIAHTTVTTERGQICVSTVFLVLDHGWNGPPVLWETMVFGGLYDRQLWRYTSRDDAEVGHHRAVSLVLSWLDAEGVTMIAHDTFTAPREVGRLGSDRPEGHSVEDPGDTISATEGGENGDQTNCRTDQGR